MCIHIYREILLNFTGTENFEKYITAMLCCFKTILRNNNRQLIFYQLLAFAKPPTLR